MNARQLHTGFQSGFWRDFRVGLAATVITLLAACAAPPVPDWQRNAYDAIERATIAYLTGNARVEAHEFARANAAVASTGRADLLARTALTRCALALASVVLDSCGEFEKFRADAALAERAYANYLAGSHGAADIAALPEQHRAVASLMISAVGNDQALSAALKNMADPLARLIAAGVLFKRGQANPDSLNIAAESASAQGWSRPLLAWLTVQLKLAKKAGDTARAMQLQRRIGIISGGA